MARKKGKTIQMPSPETYIKTRARTLPVGKCYILPDWENSSMTPVVVSRVHVTGQLTFASYLIDLFCLGVKDAYCTFNTDPEDLEDIVQRSGLIEVDYTVAHNVVYGALEFAEEFGLKPHPDWDVAQFILEEDTDAIPLIEYTFGEEGVPVFVPGPHDDVQKIKQVVSTLERTAGPGNFKYSRDGNLAEDSFEDDEAWDDEDRDDDDDLHEQYDVHDFIGDIFEPGSIGRILEGEEDPNAQQQFIIMLVTYGNKFENVEALWRDRQQRLGEDVDLLDLHFILTTDPELNNQISRIEEEYGAAVRPGTSNIARLQTLRRKESDCPYLYYLEYLSCKEAQMEREADDIAGILLAAFPDFVVFRFLHACDMVFKGRFTEAAEHLGAEYLSARLPDRESFAKDEYIFFHTAWCLYYTEKGLLDSAIPYANIILTFISENAMVEMAIGNLAAALTRKLIESGKV